MKDLGKDKVNSPGLNSGKSKNQDQRGWDESNYGNAKNMGLDILFND